MVEPRTAGREAGAAAGPTTGRPSAIPWKVVAEAFLLSRAISLVSLIVAGSLWEGRPTVGSLSTFDGNWYADIASLGYGRAPVAHVQTRWPFFPLLPAVGHVGVWLGISPRLVMVVASHLAFAAALVGIYKLVVTRLGASTARRAVWVTALFPAAFVFSMAYPDSLFLAASVWSFVFLAERRWLATGLLATAAAFSRPNGGLVVVALVVALVAQRDATRRGALAGVVTPPVLAIGAWIAWTHARTGDAFAFLSAKGAWQEVRLVDLIPKPPLHTLPHLACAALAIACLVVERHRLPIAWLTLSVVWLGPPLVLGVVGLGRYTNACFPAMAAVASSIDRIPPRLARAVHAAPIVAIVGLITFAVLVARLRFVP